MNNETEAGDRPPNLLLILTDQQRQPRHWPEDPEWLEALIPADVELARTGLTFTETCTASCMCSPSRASLFTGRWPAEHGVNLTLTRGGFRPIMKNAPQAMRAAVNATRTGEISGKLAAKNFIKGATRRPDGGDEERELDPETPNLATVLGRAGYRTVLKGKWHLTQPAGEEWAQADADRIEAEYGFEGWVPPDAGENLDPTHFGGGHGSGKSEEGFDEDFARQAIEFLENPPAEPWALVVSLVNPHDVLGYPDTYGQGGYDRSEWSDLEGIGFPPTVNEHMGNKPTVQAMMKIGQSSFLGKLNSEEALDYCRFYAHLHRLVDSKVGRILDVLGDPEDPESLRSKTVIVKTSDHGEMGMSHGGMRQKAFNAYDETINVPLIVSNPIMFPKARTSAAPVSLCDLLPTMATMAGVDTSADGITGRDLTPIIEGEADSVQDHVLFTFDDHQAASAFRNVAPPPNRIRAVRSAESMYGVYLDEETGLPPQFELYDMSRDPDQANNLVDRDTGQVISSADQPLLDRMRVALTESCERAGASLPG